MFKVRKPAESGMRDSAARFGIAREKWHEKAAGCKPSGFFLIWFGWSKRSLQFSFLILLAFFRPCVSGLHWNALVNRCCSISLHLKYQPPVIADPCAFW